MLVLTQLGVGSLAFEALRAGSRRRVAGRRGDRARRDAARMGAANLHLGRPQYAFRVVLGLRTSWMSREIVALGAFAGAARRSPRARCCRISYPRSRPAATRGARAVARRRRCSDRLLAVFCSVMIYADTQRPLWR
jgi:hypothetical protein